MTEPEESAIATLDEQDAAMQVPGFDSDAFDVFALPDFAARMPALKATLTPRLRALGDAALPFLHRAMGLTFYPHVAQHLRRTTHPAVETWVAFAEEKRAYKPFVHYRAVLDAEHLRVVVFVEDYADEKAVFAENLARNADALSAYFAAHPFLLAYDIPDAIGEPTRGHALTAETLVNFSARLKRLKGQHAAFGLAFARTHPVLAGGPELVEAVVAAMHTLRPLYDCRRADFTYTYVAEEIPGL